MRNLVSIALVSALVYFLAPASALARCGHGCGGGHSRHHHGHCGCGGYSSCGGCYSGGCGSCGGCYSGGCGAGGCSSCYVYDGAPAGTVVESTATLVVTLPEDARLMVDDHLTVSTSGERVFTTPVLEPGKDYQYTLAMEVVRDGKTCSVTREVTVRVGEVTRVDLEVPVVVAAN
jgi:uncharacterized protein (TIGR03000 family)